MLRYDDQPPIRPQRVLIAGVTGAGKSTLARRVGERLGLRHIELDALYHGPNWKPRPAFLDEVRAFAAEERWVTEWQYTSRGTDEILTPRADLAVWLDYPPLLVRRWLLIRTLRRRLGREQLWNGNTEQPLWTILRDPDHILRWQHRTINNWADKMPRVRAGFPDLPIVRLHHPAETDDWLNRL